MYYNITHVKKSPNIFDILTFKFDLIVLNNTFSVEIKKLQELFKMRCCMYL